MWYQLKTWAFCFRTMWQNNKHDYTDVNHISDLLQFNFHPDFWPDYCHDFWPKTIFIITIFISVIIILVDSLHHHSYTKSRQLNLVNFPVENYILAPTDCCHNCHCLCTQQIIEYFISFSFKVYSDTYQLLSLSLSSLCIIMLLQAAGDWTWYTIQLQAAFRCVPIVIKVISHCFEV